LVANMEWRHVVSDFLSCVVISIQTQLNGITGGVNILWCDLSDAFIEKNSFHPGILSRQVPLLSPLFTPCLPSGGHHVKVFIALLQVSAEKSADRPRAAASKESYRVGC